MLLDIKEIFLLYEMCKKSNKRINHPKSIILCKDGEPFEQQAIDIIRTMPHNLYDKHFIIIAINYFTRWLEACAIKIHDGKAVRMYIGSKIISKFGTFKILITDYGREFISQDTQAYLQGKEIEHHTTTPYHHITYKQIVLQKD